MPKETKKRQNNVHTINLDTGWFQYQQLRESGVAYIIALGVDIFAKTKEQTKMWPTLLTQMELITKKEGYTELFHTGSHTPDTIQPFIEKKWTILKTAPLKYMEPLSNYVLYRDLADVKVPSVSMATLLGDDIKKKVSQIISSSSISSKTDKIDKDLEPDTGPLVDQLRPRGRDFDRIIIDDIAPAEPLEIREGEPVRAGNLRPRWGVDNVWDNLGRPAVVAAGPENPQQIPRGALPPEFFAVPEPNPRRDRVRDQIRAQERIRREQRERELMDRIMGQNFEVRDEFIINEDPNNNN